MNLTRRLGWKGGYEAQQRYALNQLIAYSSTRGSATRKGWNMKRLSVALIATVATLLFATAAQAQEVTHSSTPVSGKNVARAGKLCDAAVKTTFSGTVQLTVFGDPNNPTKVIEHDTFKVVHTNLATGQYATEFNRGTAHSTGATTKLTGLFTWHVRNEAGKLVLNGAGQLTFREGQVLKQTPGLHNDPSLLCPIIGANPA
jgi:hypothetical protein